MPAKTARWKEMEAVHTTDDELPKDGDGNRKGSHERWGDVNVYAPASVGALLHRRAWQLRRVRAAPPALLPPLRPPKCALGSHTPALQPTHPCRAARACAQLALGDAAPPQPLAVHQSECGSRATLTWTGGGALRPAAPADVGALPECAGEGSVTEWGEGGGEKAIPSPREEERGTLVAAAAGASRAHPDGATGR